MTDGSVVKRTRRKLGELIKDPIDRLYSDIWLDSLIFIERNHGAAMRTRAAALMYIHRNDLRLTTAVRGERIWIFKEKDFEGSSFEVDLRDAS